MTTPTHVKLQAWWSQTDSGIETKPIPDHRLKRLEGRYCLTLPDDFRQYLALSSPINEAWDSENTTWWHFERIKSVQDELPDEPERFMSERSGKFLFFADHCIWCWAWAISCADDETHGKVAVIGGPGGDRLVADSFSDFVQRYISDLYSVC